MALKHVAPGMAHCFPIEANYLLLDRLPLLGKAFPPGSDSFCSSKIVVVDRKLEPPRPHNFEHHILG